MNVVQTSFFVLDGEGRIECCLYAYKTANRSVAKMFVLLSKLSDILDLTAEQLQYIPKLVLLRVCGHYVHYLWDNLPEHIKADSDIQQHRRYLKHYNLPCHRTHFDGPLSLIKNCNECQR